MVSCFLGIYISVGMEFRKKGIKEKAIYIGITSSRGFIKAIAIFIKAENKDGVILNIARVFFHLILFL